VVVWLIESNFDRMAAFTEKSRASYSRPSETVKKKRRTESVA